MNRPVLLLGAEPRIAVTIARSLHRHGISIDVGVMSADEPALHSRAIRQFLRFPSASKDSGEFLKSLREHILANGYDVLIPTSDTTLAACMNHYRELSQLLHVASPPPEITGRVLNKSYTLQAAEELGIRMPRTYKLASLQELESSRELLRFPLIAKPGEKRQVGSFKTRRFDGYDELHAAFSENMDFGRQNLIQQFCSGVGVGIEALMHRGEAIALFQHRRLKELPASGGVSVMAVAEELDPSLVEQSVRLLRRIEWEGVAMVEFLFDPSTRSTSLMEINGRYWGSLPLPVHSGVDFPFWHWQVIHAQQPDALRPYQPGLRVRWLTGDLLRLHGLFFESAKQPALYESRWKELARFIGDFRPSTKDMLWSWRDPAPAFSELKRELRHMLAVRLKSAVGKLLPGSLKAHLRARQKLERAARSTYSIRQLSRGVGLIRDRSRRLPHAVRSIVCLCHGNIIRSPMAAELLNKWGTGQNKIAISSAGLYAKPGKLADPRALSAAALLGVSLNNHSAQPLTAEMVSLSDLILVMDFENEAVLLSRFPQARKKTFLLGGFAAGSVSNSSVEIPDPYDGELSDVRACYEQMEPHLRELARQLSLID